MKKIICVFLALFLLIPKVGFAYYNDDLIENIRVYQLGLMEGTGLNSKITRAELAAIATRLKGLEYMKDLGTKSSPFKDLIGWEAPSVNMAYELNLMQGVSKGRFNPRGNLSYLELLTVLMRILGYEDAIDFKVYPEDYYSKALEIGLGNLYISQDEIVTRGLAATTINHALDLKLKNQNTKLIDLQTKSYMVINNKKTNDLDNKPSKKEKISIINLDFNTSILGVFSGELLGKDDFTGYKVILLSSNDKILDSVKLDKRGKFSISGFDIGVVTRLQGYKYEVHSPKGDLILWENLE